LKVRLFEVFTSLEGEGTLYGTKTMFVRLAGCPFSCFYCDTADALPADSGTEYSVEEACEIIDRNLQQNTYKVNFTGGDPLMQPDAVTEMARHVRSKGIPTYLESSCFDSKRFAQILPQIDLVKIELKTRDSEFVDDSHYPNLVENALDCLRLALSSGRDTYIKVVVSSRTTEDEMAGLVGRIFGVAGASGITGFIIQPTYGVAEPALDLLLRLYDVVCRHYGDVRIVPQLHKFIGAP
jgi:organic radical activating enzyme